MKVDFPEPVGPTRNTNSCLAMSQDTSRRATTPSLYVLVTFSARIIRGGVLATAKGCPESKA
jgi:hypothetical protein